MINTNLKGIWWWGYLHANDTIQVKRWWGDHADYTTDCQGNPFVRAVVKPFQAESWDAAYKIIAMHLKG